MGALLGLLFGDVSMAGRAQSAQVLQAAGTAAAEDWQDVVCVPRIACHRRPHQPVQQSLVAAFAKSAFSMVQALVRRGA